ncbi:MAG: hypothetical protein ABH842_03575 [Candidatus Micrarchaeota archaeon]
MKILFRVDGNQNIARCLALASGLKETEPISEILFCGSNSIKDQVLANNFSYKELGSPFEIGMEDLEAIIEQEQIQILIIDFKRITENHINHLSKKVLLVVFDDGSVVHCNAKILVNPNIYAHLIRYTMGDETELLLGTEFYPLLSEFDQHEDFERTISDSVKHILIDLEDDGAITVQIIQILKDLKDHFSVTIVTGKNFIKGEDLAKLIGLDGRFIVLQDPDPIKRFSIADIAITNQNWFNEIMFFRLPSLVIGPKSNLLDYIGKNELALTLMGTPNNDEMRSVVFTLFKDKNTRENISKRLFELIDNLGRFRLANEILESYKSI